MYRFLTVAALLLCFAQTAVTIKTCYQCADATGGATECGQGTWPPADPANLPAEIVVETCTADDIPCVTIRTQNTDDATFSVTRDCAENDEVKTARTVYTQTAGNTVVSHTYCIAENNCNSEQSATIENTCHECESAPTGSCGLQSYPDLTAPAPLTKCRTTGSRCATALYEDTGSGDLTFHRYCENIEGKTENECISEGLEFVKRVECFCEGDNCNTRHIENIPSACFTCLDSVAGIAACKAPTFAEVDGIKRVQCSGPNIPCVTTRTDKKDNEGATSTTVIRGCGTGLTPNTGTVYGTPDEDEFRATTYCDSIHCNNQNPHTMPVFSCYTCGNEGQGPCSSDTFDYQATPLLVCSSNKCIVSREEKDGLPVTVKRGCAAVEKPVGPIFTTPDATTRFSEIVCDTDKCNKEISLAMPFTCYTCGTEQGQKPCTEALVVPESTDLAVCENSANTCQTIRKESGPTGSTVTVTRGCSLLAKPAGGPFFSTPIAGETLSDTYCTTPNCNKEVAAKIPFTCYEYSCGGTGQDPCPETDGFNPATAKLIACPVASKCAYSRTETKTGDDIAVAITRGCAADLPVGDTFTAPAANIRHQQTVCDTAQCNKESSVKIPFTCYKCDPAVGRKECTLEEVVPENSDLERCTENEMCYTKRTQVTAPTAAITIARGCAPKERTVEGILYSAPALSTKVSSAYCQDANCNSAATAAIDFLCYACEGSGCQNNIVIATASAKLCPSGKCLTSRIETRSSSIITTFRRDCAAADRAEVVTYHTPKPGVRTAELVCNTDLCNTAEAPALVFTCYECAGESCGVGLNETLADLKLVACPSEICVSERTESGVENAVPTIVRKCQTAANPPKEEGCTNTPGEGGERKSVCTCISGPNCNGRSASVQNPIRACLSCTNGESCDTTPGPGVMCPKDVPCVTVRTETIAPAGVVVKRECAENKDLTAGTIYKTPTPNTKESHTFCNSFECNKEATVKIPFTCYTCGEPGNPCPAGNFPIQQGKPQTCSGFATCLTVREDKPGNQMIISRRCATTDEYPNDHCVNIKVGDSKTATCYCKGENCNRQNPGPVYPSCYQCASCQTVGADTVKRPCTGDFPCITIRTETKTGQVVATTVERKCAADRTVLTGEKFAAPDANTKISRKYCDNFDCNNEPSTVIPFTCYTCGGTGNPCAVTGFDPANANNAPVSCPTNHLCVTTRVERTNAPVVVTRGCAPDNKISSGTFYTTPNANEKMSEIVCNTANCNNAGSDPIPFTCYDCEGAANSDCAKEFAVNLFGALPCRDACQTTKKETTVNGVTAITIKRGCSEGRKTGCRSSSSDGQTKTMDCFCEGANCNRVAADKPIVAACYQCQDTDAGKAACAKIPFDTSAVGVQSQQCAAVDSQCLTRRTEVVGQTAKVERLCSPEKLAAVVTYSTPANNTKISRDVCDGFHCNSKNSQEIPFTCYSCEPADANCNKDPFDINTVASVPCPNGNVCLTIRTDKGGKSTYTRRCAADGTKKEGCTFKNIDGGKESECLCNTAGCNRDKSEIDAKGAGSVVVPALATVLLFFSALFAF